MIKDNVSRLVNFLIKKKITISSVESLTGGFFISNLIRIPGASKVVKGGLVVYQTNIKINLLGIKKEIIEKYGVVSEEVAKLMAINGFKKLKSNLVVSFTGNAGPGKEKGLAKVGDVYVGIKYNKKIKIFFMSFCGSRNDIINNVVNKTIDILIKELEGDKNAKK